MRIQTGLGRLDDLLGGGLPERSHVLLHGPPFAGKRLIGDLFLLAGLDAGEPAIVVTCNAAWGDVRERLAGLSDRFPAHEAAGLIRYVDAYSYQLSGVPPPPPSVTLVDSLQNLSDLAFAMNEAHRDVASDGRRHRVVLDSLSTIVVQTNAQTTFRFLQTFIGRSRRSGASGLLTLEHGMHPPQEVEGFKSLHDGVIELKREDDRRLLRAQGLALYGSPGWVEYRQTAREIELVGSLAGGRVR